MLKSNNGDKEGRGPTKGSEPPRALGKRLYRRSHRYQRIGTMFLYYGTIILLASFFIYDSSILALIGLGLTFWGAVFLFIRTNKYVRGELIDSTIISSLTSIDKILKEMKYAGKGIHLPPRYLKGFKELIMFIPKEESAIAPKIEDIIQGKVFINPHGICITPPGQSLLTLYEEKIKTDFSKTDLNQLEDNLARILIEDLEIVENIELAINGNEVRIRMMGSVVGSFCEQIRRNANICNNIGCPLCSSIACALAKVTDRAVVIERTDLLEDRIVDTRYNLINGIKE